MAFFLSSTNTLFTNLSTKFIPKFKNSSLHHSFPGEVKRQDLCVCLCVNAVKAGSQSTILKTSGNPRKKWKPLLSEGRDEDEEYGLVCPGCGVFMQDEDENLPGFYQKRKVEAVVINEEDDLEIVDEDEEDFDDEIKGEVDESDVEDEDLGETLTRFDLGKKIEGKLTRFDLGDDIDLDEDELDSDFDDDDDDDVDDDDDYVDDDDYDDDDDEEDKDEIDGFAAPGVGYGNITEESLEKGKKKRISKSERKQKAREALKEREEVTVCARCHSLRNYGQVKNQTAENLIPDFDFDRLISTRLMKPTGKPDSVVVVMVVDCVDFEGSFPKRASKSLFKALEGTKSSSNVSKKLPKLVLVATKADLLPSQISPARLDRWIRHRAKANGAPKLSGVYIVSSRKDLGVRNLLGFVKELAGPRGNVWVIGAQNAGKSTLINAFAKKQGVKVSKLTEAAIPGTTLGILRIGGVLPAKAKMYDTPGLLHPYLMTMRLNRDEQKMVELRKELRPRSFRIKEGQTIHVGALMRLDLSKASVETIYVTIWASPNVSLHLGKTENADEIWSKHAGVRLQPPVGRRVNEMGEWVEREVNVKGISWDVNSIDISVAGLGWVSLGLKGEATLTFFTYEGIEVILREPLVLDRARFLERPGFCLPKGLSEAINNQIKLEAQSKNDQQEQNEELIA